LPRCAGLAGKTLRAAVEMRIKLQLLAGIGRFPSEPRPRDAPGSAGLVTAGEIAQ